MSQPDAVHVTCFCLYYSQRSPAFPLGLFFPSTSSCFCSSCSSCVFVCGFFFVCTRCLLSLTDDERKDTVSLQSWPLICLPPLLLNQSLQRHTKRCHGFLLLLSLSFFFIYLPSSLAFSPAVSLAVLSSTFNLFLLSASLLFSSFLLLDLPFRPHCNPLRSHLWDEAFVSAAASEISKQMKLNGGKGGGEGGGSPCSSLQICNTAAFKIMGHYCLHS